MTKYKDEAKKAVSNNVRKYREAIGLTQTALSLKIRKSSEYISRVERAVMISSVDVLYEIADILNIEPSKLLAP